ncbi:MAG: effector binding domain-containing protein [Prevotella sp.]|nr:effector binding domain-containing protein [Prevotella sp.]
MNYEIVELKEKTAAVLTARTNNSSPEMGEIIGGLWQKFYSEEIFPALKNRANAYALGLYTEYASDEKGDYTAAVGCETTDETELPDGMKTIKIPAGKYAVFSITGEMDFDGQLAALQNLRRELWGTDLKRSYVCDFEEYRSADPKYADIRVYIGLKQGAETGTDFSKVTPCGGDCRTCERFGNACEGCLKTGGKRRFSEQESSCEIFGCCVSHGVRFCGLCGEFPCERVKNEITQWDSGAVENLAGLAAEYRKRETEFSDRFKKIERYDVNEDWAHSGIVRAGDFCFLNYCASGKGETVEQQIGGAFDEMEKRLTAVGLNLENVVQINCLFKNIWDIPAMEKVVKERFNGKYPARKSIQTEFAHDGLLFQADAVAYSPK